MRHRHSALLPLFIGYLLLLDAAPAADRPAWWSAPETTGFQFVTPVSARYGAFVMQARCLSNAGNGALVMQVRCLSM